MKILLVGGGGREHALAWQLAQSDRCEALYCAPGNAGIAECAECVDIGAEDVNTLVAFAKDKAIDLVVVGPEGALVTGLADRLLEANIKVFGCSKAAAQLEGSKGFMKDLCAKYDIPTAAYGRFTDIESAKKFITQQDAPIVIKTDGLAAGKGVIIAQSIEEAEKTVEDMLSGVSFGDAGREIIIEQFLDGEELSFFALADGKTVLPLTSAQDHKQVGEGDTGPNTGGMGAYSPAHMMNEELGRKINDNLIQPTIKAMAAEGCPFTGVLFAGIMVVKGEPILIEYNIRFGDPECQPLMMRLDCDLLEILDACAEGRLDEVQDQIHWRDETALCVVMAAKGYPGSYVKDTVIDLGKSDLEPGTKVFHAGTKYDPSGKLLSTGGRVLGVTALGTTIEQANQNAYRATGQITWPDGFYRRDIGWRALEAEKENEKKSIPC